MKFTTMSFVLILMLSVSPTAAMATPDALSQCVMAALYGPEKKSLKIFDHEFHCKPVAQVALSGGGTQFAGQLSHALRFRPDDQLYYQFVIQNGVLVTDSLKIRIKEGGFDDIAGLAGQAVAAYYGVQVSPEQAATYWDKAAKSVVGRGWNEVADNIISIVSVEAAAVASLSKGVPIQQKSSGRYLDAHQGADQDYQIVTRPQQENDTQKWILKPFGKDTYTIQQKSSSRYMDAHRGADQGYRIVTRPQQENDSQKWILTPLGNDTYTIQQKSSGRYMDAQQGADQIVTRPKHNNDSQWLLILR